jgi:hypothetical protein
LKVLEKIKFKIKKKIIDYLFGIKINFIFYKCYWVYKIKVLNSKKKKYKNFLSIRVHPGSGIGHQLANYNAGLWFSKKFKLNHCHNEFPNKKWESLLNFSKNSIDKKKLIKSNYKIIQLPRFDEYNITHIKIIKKIINQYSNQKILFYLEFDQAFKSQYQVSNTLKYKFFNKRNSLKDKIIFSKKYFNIAVHYRSGDILKNKSLINQRKLNSNYYLNSLKIGFKLNQTNKRNKIFIFSQGHDLHNLLKKNNINYLDCNKFNEFSTFLHFIYSDLLITSKSSFSYKAGLIGNNIKISPKDFWHKYPKNDKKWFLIDNNYKLKI